nr:MAG TPA: hypothetical protein [Caudoviricetes sp.]
MWYPRYLWIQSESYTNATVLLSRTPTCQSELHHDLSRV